MPTSIKTILHNAYQPLVLLKPYLRLALLLLTGFTAVGMGAEALGRNAETPLNPFEAYLDIFPGQPLSAVVKRGVSCWFVEDYYATPTQEHCVLTPTAGIFSMIEVMGFRLFQRNN